MLSIEAPFSGLLPTDARLPPELLLPDIPRQEAFLPLDTTAQPGSLAVPTSPGNPLAPAVLVAISGVAQGTKGKDKLRLSLPPLVLVRPKADV